MQRSLNANVSYLGVRGEMGSLGLGDLRCVCHSTVRADGRAVRNCRCINGQSGRVSVAERVPGGLVSLGSEMRCLCLRHLRRVQDLAVRSERHAGVISQISRLRGRDGAERGENNLRNEDNFYIIKFFFKSTEFEKSNCVKKSRF